MREEIASLSEISTWVLDDLPEGRKAIRNKWVFRTKKGPDGSIQRYKARLVVKGCSQRSGLDYNEVYYNLDIEQMDAVTAFLQGELKDEEIYMLQPEGFAASNGKVCRRQKALYDIQRSSRGWNAQLDEMLREFGLK